MNNHPIFIVGASRSGTTLLAAMLNAHSRIACGPESQILNKIKPRQLKKILADIYWPRLAVDALSKITIAEEPVLSAFSLQKAEVENALQRKPPGTGALFEAVAGLYAEKQGKPRWAEKTPRHLLHLHTLRSAFPEGRIIRIVRDPRDSALSMRQLPWASDTYLANLYLWCAWYEQSDAFFDRDPRAMTVIYENLIANPRAELQRICDFIGESFEEAMLDTANSGAMLATKNEIWKQQVSAPLDPGRLFRWKRELSRADRVISDTVCQKWLHKFGYECQKEAVSVLPCKGLHGRAIERNLEWIYANLEKGRVCMESYSWRTVDEVVVFMDIADFKSHRSYAKILSSLLWRRLTGKKTAIKFNHLDVGFKMKKNILRYLGSNANEP